MKKARRNRLFARIATSLSHSGANWGSPKWLYSHRCCCWPVARSHGFDAIRTLPPAGRWGTPQLPCHSTIYSGDAGTPTSSIEAARAATLSCPAGHRSRKPALAVLSGSSSPRRPTNILGKAETAATYHRASPRGVQRQVLNHNGTPVLKHASAGVQGRNSLPEMDSTRIRNCDSR